MFGRIRRVFVITAVYQWISVKIEISSSKHRNPKAAWKRPKTWLTSIDIARFFILNAARKRDGVLEPDERKRSRPVLRGERGRKSPDLLGDKIIDRMRFMFNDFLVLK